MGIERICHEGQVIALRRIPTKTVRYCTARYDIRARFKLPRMNRSSNFGC
jgi:hypothetical protein